MVSTRKIFENGKGVKMIDFSNCKIDPFRAYDGTNGSKICVIYENERYMIKFPTYSKNNKEMHYTNGCLNEHLASSIYQTLEIDTQDTILGIYNDKEVVACKDFCNPGDRIINFGMIKNQCINSEYNGFGTELNSVLEAIETQQVYDSIELKQHFWKMFVADALLGNFDRHNGNWGVIVNEINSSIRIAPVYDNGSCLYPQLLDSQMRRILQDINEINNRIYVFPNSVLKENDKKINYFDFLSHTKDKECLNALVYVHNHYNQKTVMDIIENAPISDVKKMFYETMISARNEKIIEKALELQKDFCLKLADGRYISREDYVDAVLDGRAPDLYQEKGSRIYEELER